MGLARLGSALIVLGLLAIGYAGLWQLGIAPGSRVRLPQPVALERAAPRTRDVSAPPTPAPRVAPTSAPTPMPAQTPVPKLPAMPATAPAAAPVGLGEPTTASPRAPMPVVAADAAERALPSGAGYAVRLAIPAIKVDTVVKQGGIVQDANGQPVWETLPFVAVHYGDLTSRIGAPGNAVIAGHVVTLSEGNVFRFLYQLDVGDQIEVWDQSRREHDFAVVDVKLVPPSDTSVMGPTPDETLTLITCGGTFDPARREFSDRLIVTAKPL